MESFVWAEAKNKAPPINGWSIEVKRTVFVLIYCLAISRHRTLIILSGEINQSYTMMLVLSPLTGITTSSC
jgi:hypothetical protein